MYLGVAPSTVSDWFKRRNESIPSAYIIPLSKFFNVSPLELLTGEVDGMQVLGQNELKLINNYRTLSFEGQTIVQAAAINEKRKVTEQ
ncbi:MAG: hypothetical protein IKR85_02920 [Clostridia bacterium]|nr:hypothetical protein [Clostridia bacterium]